MWEPWWDFVADISSTSAIPRIVQSVGTVLASSTSGHEPRTENLKVSLWLCCLVGGLVAKKPLDTLRIIITKREF
jgi:hypothetical protein